MTHDMNMRRFTQIVFTLLILFTSGVEKVWAVGTSDIYIFSSDNGSISVGEVVTLTGGDFKVTLTAVPNSGYTIAAKDFSVLPADDPSQAPKHRTLGVASELEVSDESTATDRIFSFILPKKYAGAMVTAYFTNITPISISDISDITNPSGNYKLNSGFSVSGSRTNNIGSSSNPFRGSIEGYIYDSGDNKGQIDVISLSAPLFDYVKDATIKNIVVEGTISGSGNVGAIAGNALGASRIYNCGVLATGSTVKTDDDGYTLITSCSSTISGGSYVGGIVGFLDGTSRVINCYSYADVISGTYRGGIVGWNNVATTSSNLATMVMNCMFYGDITGGNRAPIYNGEIITNDGDDNGVNNFNYFRLESSYIQDNTIPKVYNCALGAETRFLQRFEFYRHLLNSNRELAAWWATGDADNKDEMMKWVLEPSQIGSSTPYPILKTLDKYASVVNYKPSDEAYDGSEANRNKGLKLTQMGGTGTDAGKLSVTIQMGQIGDENKVPYGAPSGAGFKSDFNGTIKLTITDKDYDHFNFNYGKVQLPYYNDYCNGNYTGNRVVTGWKIVSITGGTAGSYSTGDDVTYNDKGELTATPYNFADRKCKNKDLYSESGRVFNQGAYWDVPEGVTAITIQPYWAKCAYLADAYSDVVYKTSGTDEMVTVPDVTTVGGGKRYASNGVSTNINGSSQMVYTNIATARSNIGTSGTVYDNAIVLVGNYHYNVTGSNQNIGSNPYTMMSVDLDWDNEPDASLIMRFNGRAKFHASRYDFLNLIGLGMAQKTTGGTGTYNFGIIQPLNWFEVTNTALFRATQFEYSPASRAKKPIILHGGVIEQWVTQQQDAGDAVEYFHVGSNVWFKEFHRGSHQDNENKSTPHPPLSVTGGDFSKFYLTGYYQSKATIYNDNAECYINGGRFGEIAGAGMEGIGTSDGKGNITWIIDNADIKEFYGGGINHAKPVHGNIHTIISNSHVDVFCGGPKFGNMEPGRTVTTTATNCTFGTYFGAGFGGNSYSRYAPRNHNNILNFPHNDGSAGNHDSWNDWLSKNYKQNYDANKGGISTQFDYQFLPQSSNLDNVARIFVDYVAFSLATCHNVTSSLTGCTITGHFYGGGSLGKVDGNVTSTLSNCTVNGNVYGAGYSASLPPVEVMSVGFQTEPYYYEDLGTYRKGVFPTPTTTYHWQHANAISVDNIKHILYTTEDLDALGTVEGKVTLNIEGENTSVTGNIYGGGQSSDVYGVNSSSDVTSEVEVNIKGGSMTDVYGGGEGQTTVVGGDVTVNIGKLKEGKTDEYEGNATVTGSVYGGSALGAVNAKKDTDWDKETNPDDFIFIDGKETKVNILKGTVNGNVYGGGLGDLASLGTDHSDVAAKVYGDVTVTVGVATETAATTVPIIEGSVYGGSNVNGVLEKGARVDIISGTIGKETTTSNTTTLSGGNVHGGGYGQPTLVKGDVTVNVGVETNDTPAKHYGFATIKGDVYGGSAKGNVNATPNSSDVLELTSATVKTDVNLYGGTINGDLYGGGLGYLHSSSETENDDVAANVYGNVTVTVEGGKANRVFGCNNIFGTPKGTVDVTVNGTNATVVDSESGDKTYALQGVYGGGNQAHYDPTTTNATYPRVTINGCTSSIKDVFGGGNAAAVPNTNVIINGGDISRVFAGGNGESGTPANVGWKTDAASPADADKYTGTYDGAGSASLQIKGGTIIDVFGGSNANGKIRAGSAVNIAKDGSCEMHITNVFGGGNEAAGAAGTLTIGCTGTDSEGITNVFGGANKAAVTGDIELNITGGRIANVYGGNNETGNIDGTITVNVEWNGSCENNYLGNVYGGGKDAAYGDADHNKGNYPVVNIKNGTVSGSVFGGGFGSTAVVYANPQVTIGHATEGYDADVTGDVYGGGDAAAVEGTPVVHVINKDNTSIGNVYGGGNAADVSATSVTIDGGTIGLVFGGGHGDKNSDPQKAANVSGNVAVAINGGTITKVFGGSNSKGNIGGTITLGIEKSATASTMKIGEVYGGGNEADGNAGTITIGCTGTWTTEGTKNHTNHNSTDNRIGYELEGIGTVYGGANAANIGTSTAQSNISLTIGGGIIENVYGGNNTSGAISGTIDVNINKDDNAICADNWYVGNVYGGGNLAAYSGSPTVTVTNGQVSGRVFGGGNQANVGGSTVNINGGGVGQGVYGGCNTSGTIGGAVTVTVKGGTLGSSSAIEAITDKTPETLPNILFGGGKGSGTSITGLVTLNVGEASSDNALIYGNVYGGSEEGEVSVANVNLNGNTIQGNVFGGGYRTAEGKTSATNVTVTLDGTTFDRTYDGTAQIFGANNVQGSPTGHVLVHVKNTAPVSGQTYDLAAVYGGGNNADYNPTDETQTAEVIIEGCNTTSIENVYGGGNAAAVPGTEVWILGAKVIDNVFGGGNGELGPDYAAHVGFHRTSATTKSDYDEGAGKTYVKLVGGTIHTVYGGSNSNGDIRGGSDISMPTAGDFVDSHSSMSAPDCCSTLTTTNIYGGGKNADMSGGTTVKLGCIEGLTNVYGGARDANIKGGVNLVITGGNFENVFGGNDTSGTIQGSIKLYIEESCAALNITNLYLGGNLAPYSVYGYKQGASGLVPRQNSGDEEVATGTTPLPSTGKYADPELYVTKFTKIDNVFGGGYGETAVVYGSPTIFINEVPNLAGNIGEVGNVFGGGDAANVKGDATINIGTSSTVYMKTDETDHDVKGVKINGNIYGGGNAADVEGTVAVTIGTENLRHTAENDGKQGTVITGNIFGGGLGNTTTVTGSVNVNIGGNSGTVETPNYIGYADITGDIYGGSAKGKVNATKSGTAPNLTYTASTGTTNVNLYGGTITGSIYGGGYGKDPVDNTDENSYNADVYGAVTVSVYGGSVTNVFGCNNVFGAPQNTVSVGVDGGIINNNVYGGGNQAAYTVETNPNKDTAGNYRKYPVVNINNGTIQGNVFGGGLGTTATVTGNPQVTVGDNVSGHVIAIKKSVYGGGEMASVNGSTNVSVSNGTIGTEKDDLPEGVTAGAVYGNVYGGGLGSDGTGSLTDLQKVQAGLVKGNTKVTISDGNILHNVYGGGAYGSVGTFNYDTNGNIVIDNITNKACADETGKAEVIITGGTFGVDGHENGMVFGSSRGDVGDLNSIHNKLAWVYNTDVKIGTSGSGTVYTTPTIYGSVYGGGENGHNYNNSNVYIYSGIIGMITAPAADNSVDSELRGANYPYRGNVYGGGCGTDTYKDGTEEKYNPLAGIVRGSATVNISGGYVVHNVYGAGAMGSVGTADVATSGKTTVTISGGRIGYDGSRNGNVFGAARGEYGTSTAASGFANVSQSEVNISYATTPTADNDGKTENLIAGSVFGGGEAGTVKGSVAVNMTGGLILKDVYGGGALADTQTDNWNGTTWADGKSSSSSTTTVSLTGGRIVEEAYGGGLGEAGKPAYVYGDVTVKLNEGVTSTRGCAVGQVFGANNVNGTPKGNVTVHVYATQSNHTTKATSVAQKFVSDKVVNEALEDGNATVDDLKAILADKIIVGTTLSIEGIATYQAVYDNASATAAAVKEAINNITTAITSAANTDAKKATVNALRYDVKAVYGGGNQAAYDPASPYTATNTTGTKSQVIIEGCSTTSIETVYGGGNAAAVPETNVEIREAYEIGSVFGGGNGKDAPAPGVENPGADVGINGSTDYGTGNANLMVMGGYIHEVYGGSNEKGNIRGTAKPRTNPDGSTCELEIEKIVGAGKNADINGNVDMVLDCMPSKKVPLLFAGADNANVNGYVKLTITNGTFGKVFGGNNEGGAIFGQIQVNVEETGCNPIIIDELYACGNQAAYSVYGYKTGTDGKAVPQTEAELRAALHTAHPEITDDAAFETLFENTKYADPVVNVVSCTSIGKVFGGGYGARATVYGNPTVNINQIIGTPTTGGLTTLGQIGVAYTDENGNPAEGGIFGGGNQAKVEGNTTVNIGTEESYTLVSGSKTAQTILGANIVGDVYGGGNLADVTGNTNVNICARYNTSTSKWEGVTPGTSGVIIAGDVFGGGKGEAAETGDRAFYCEKAMVGKNDDNTGTTTENANYGTHVRIGNGTVNGSVYGGGEIGRVEFHTEVTIGYGNGTSGAAKSPIIRDNVFGAGKGANTHGYSGLVRGDSKVTVQGDAKVGQSVYGGGEMASVGKYVLGTDGLPVEHKWGGRCYVTVQGYTEIGPDDMTMTAAGGPVNSGHVFGAGKGVVPYEGITGDPYSIEPTGKVTYTSTDEEGYFTFIRSLALASYTDVTIGGNTFVKGSVYGGSQNGRVQENTKVTISGGQIGNGYVQMADDGTYLTTKMSLNRPYSEAEWSAGHLITTNDPSPLQTAVGSNYSSSLPECASWDYGKTVGTTKVYAPYDPYAHDDGYYYNGTTKGNYAEGALPIASDGHTFYGNVFGGGSGYFPYKDRNGQSRWLMSAGSVGGNTEVNITAGHILTNVYGGNEMTNVGGKSTVKMSGGTLGVPRTLDQIIAHPLTCYLFGAGKGDQRVFFNKATNVEDVDVQISGGWIYGSVFGGGEDGHVLRDVKMTISGTVGTDAEALAGTATKIGTWGTSYVDGNVFGGGRGFGADAYTAGNVAGSVKMDISGGKVLGSIYGGGRLGSVGYGLYNSTGDEAANYGAMRDDTKDDAGTTTTYYTTDGLNKLGRGHIVIEISGGQIGNELEYIVPNTDATTGNTPNTIIETDFTKWSDDDWKKWKKYNSIPNTEFDKTTGRLTHTKGGNVFTGGMGRRTQLDGVTPISDVDWWKLGNAKSTKLTIKTGAVIKSNVYGGGELGAVTPFTSGTTVQGGTTEIDIQGGAIGQAIGSGADQYTFGSVFGGGMGSEADLATYAKIGGSVQSTKVTMSNGTVLASVYGGGELALVEGSHTTADSKVVGTEINISGGYIGKDRVVSGENTYYFGGADMGNVYGGGKGSLNTYDAGLIKTNTLVNISGTPTIYHNIYGGGAYGTVGEFNYPTDGSYNVTSLKTENTGTAMVTITGGTIGTNGKENGMIYGSSRGDVSKAADGQDPNNKLAWVNNANVIIGTANGSDTDLAIKGSVYGSGENGHVLNNTAVTIHSGTIGIPEGEPVNGLSGAQFPNRGNVYGGGCGTDDFVDNGKHYFNKTAGIVRGNATITMDGGYVVRNVYGGGAMGSVGGFTRDASKADTDPYKADIYVPTKIATGSGKCSVAISGGTVGPKSGDVPEDAGNVFAAGRGEIHDATEYPNYERVIYVNDAEVTISNTASIKGSVFGGSEAGHVWGNTHVSIAGGTIEKSVYGGGEVGWVRGAVAVDMTEGNVTKDVYGGGALADTNIGNVTNYGATDQSIASTATYNTAVSLKGGVISGFAYGGALGDTNTPAYVYGDVTVKLNENKTAGDKGCIVGKVFGCNNLNGTPKGKVRVYVYATQNKNASYATIGSNKTDTGRHDGFETLTGDQTTTYDVEAVYGGGNLSPYEPVDAYSDDEAKKNAAQTEVYINGCGLTSIKYVYGGGNAASAPATNVLVTGAYEIEELFAGGNGKDEYVINGKYYVNPGANVGYTNYTHLDGNGDGSATSPYNCVENADATTKEQRQTAANGYMYGSGIARIEVLGGYIHAAYGGSNEKGNVRYQAWSKYEEGSDCALQVQETYGGGKNSEIDGEIKLNLGCTTYMPEIFGGSKNADVFSDIELNIANGRYDRVFGGNNTSGNIHGSITVNIKENGCVPINIKNLYLGGYLAGYSIYGYKDDGTIRTKAEYDALEDKSGIVVRKNPRINVISASRIDSIFGGGYQATVVGDPHVNINMEQGRVEVSGKTLKEGTTDVYIYKDGNNTEYASDAYTIENVGEQYYAVLPLGTIGNVYGGGNEADIIGDTYVEIGTGTYHDANGNLVAITPARNAAMITGSVFGGGKGVADSFLCDKAMVGVMDKGFGSTHVTIENGTVNGNVYGGGQIGRVEHDTWVTIGKEGDETNSPVVKGDVFGAGKGLKTHGYSALVRGKATVTVQGKAHVEGSVYGGGEIASVGKYKVKKAKGDPADAPDWVPVGMPYSLYDETSESGNCNVVVRDNAIIGPETPMQMKKTGDPDDTGHVFGAGKGVLPYEGYGVVGDDWVAVPWRMAPDNKIDYYSEDKYVKKEDGLDYKAAYLQFIETLALATETNVNISGNAFVKGSVYGGSMNGHVQHHTRVTIAGGQIGAGDGMSQPYKETDWTGETTPAGGWKECAHWDYVDNGAPYDPLATAEGKYDYTNYPFIPEADRLTSSEGGLPTATDGHTYYGNVFGGGSGVIPYAPGLWHRASGSVGGDSYVTITGGHILTSVYGGNEQTDVGTYTKADPTVPATGGKCTVTMTGGTVGVPLEHKENYPVTGHLFGAGKGDKRILFNTWTNVAKTEVNVSGGTIYGNVYGGGEDGHVMSLSKMTISEADATTNPTIIGTTGTSGYDGDVFGGGQGSVTALTAGVVGGNVNLSIEGGTMKGSVYGGGRLASVGTFFAMASAANYGRMQDGDDHGNIVVNLTGGTIKQNVFGGCMGSTADNRLGVSKNVTVNLNGYETKTGETTTTEMVADNKKGCVVKGSVFGCNNLESSPLGDVLVHVYGTQKDGASQIANTAGSGETAAVENAKTPATQDANGEFNLSSFDVKAVYGGGNLAAYKPEGPNVTSTDYDYANTTHVAKVIIDGCGRTSIGQVYGGGNAASTPATEVTVNGTYEIGELFGGGNGKDDITINGVTKPNPGANVGYYNYSQYVEKDGKTVVEDMPAYDTKEKRLNSAIQYGTGKAAVNIFGGKIHRVFGGSNTKGNVRQSAITLLEEAGGCDFCVDEAYGGGKSAPMDAEAKLLMSCIPGLKAVYGGAQAADVYDDVSVTITNGNFDRVFGGNNLSGTIRGKITVNVEETGCRPVIIGELYGGGNQAGYSVYGYNDDGSMIESGETPLYQDPQVNVRSFTSIGNIYGGGYGKGAKMVGNPTVNINVVEGDKKDYTYDNDQSTYKVGEDNVPYYDANGFKELTLTVDGHSVVLPSHTKGKIGAINNVFGGGNAAEVVGNTNVNIGTEVGNEVNMVSLPIVDTNGDPVLGTDGKPTYEKKTVVGADIRGNVYGGGNNAEVTGNTNVTIGKQAE